MIGVVIPAHNEQRYLDACLTAVRAAAADPALMGEPVHVVVVLDSCDDGSRAIVERHGAVRTHCHVDGIDVGARNVGVARAAGAARLLEMGARWLAFTDADTRVAPAWLAAQLSLDADVVCGTVAVDDWSPHHGDAELLRQHFRRTYTDADGHRHIHGANLGVSAAAYLLAGGFAPLGCQPSWPVARPRQRCGFPAGR